MRLEGYALGIDSSTQGTTALVLDCGSLAVVAEKKLVYRDDPRLAGFGLMGETPLLPPREEGEADQPALLFVAALDAVLSDLPRELLEGLVAISVSAQQHGQVWLGAGARDALAGLDAVGAGASGAPGLRQRLGPALASERAPIWMSSNTGVEAAHLRAWAGGSLAMTALSGSDSPLRFSGAVLRHWAQREPEVYRKARRIHLISSFLASVLTGREDCPIDWGNGAGMSLMDWGARTWSPTLLGAAGQDLPEGSQGLASRLPGLAHPLASQGSVARYFCERYGIPRGTKVLTGSGDNPQAKVLASGALLSLGTSFVLMAEGNAPHPRANAMYDGLGRPFLFGCRTNGALTWEAERLSHGLGAEDFPASEAALALVAPGSVLRVLQRERESFPESPSLDLGRSGDFPRDYAGSVDSALGLLYLGALDFCGPLEEVAVTGGSASSEGVLRRVAAIWDRPVARIGRAGAAAGAAVAAAAGLVPPEEAEAWAKAAARAITARGKPILPEPSLVRAYHGEDGYLARLARLLEEGQGPGSPS